MCILVLGIKSHPKYKFIFAGNRDEYYDRPASFANIWGSEIKILSGKDLQSGGTWLGITIERNDGIPAGDFAVVTNYRDFYNFRENVGLRSRGLLVGDFLLMNYPVESYETRFEDFVKLLMNSSDNYNSFNLIYGNFDKLYYFSNVNKSVVEIPPGIHGLSNSFLNIPWPKVHWAKLRFSEIIKNSGDLISDLINLLSDNTQFDEELLPDTGIGIEVEKILSSIFIKNERYGTRSSTIILVDYDNNVQFFERNYNGESFVDRTFNFNL